MNSIPTPTSKNPLRTRIVTGTFTLFLAAAVLSGWNLRIGLSDRLAFIALLVAGMLMCSLGMQLATYGWQNPYNLAGSMLGVLILALAIAVFTGMRIPLMASDRDAFIVVTILMAGKVVFAGLRAFSKKNVLPDFRER